jgi:hypothetical protein
MDAVSQPCERVCLLGGGVFSRGERLDALDCSRPKRLLLARGAEARRTRAVASITAAFFCEIPSFGPGERRLIS